MLVYQRVYLRQAASKVRETERKDFQAMLKAQRTGQVFQAIYLRYLPSGNLLHSYWKFVT